MAGHRVPLILGVSWSRLRREISQIETNLTNLIFSSLFYALAILGRNTAEHTTDYTADRIGGNDGSLSIGFRR